MPVSAARESKGPRVTSKWCGMVDRPCGVAVASIAFVVLGACAATELEEGEFSGEVTVSRSEYGSEWPLTVDEGVLGCKGAGEVYFTAEGQTYAVNGTAQGASDGADIDAIWADDPNASGLKINIGPLIDEGLPLCE